MVGCHRGQDGVADEDKDDQELDVFVGGAPCSKMVGASVVPVIFLMHQSVV